MAPQPPTVPPLSAEHGAALGRWLAAGCLAVALVFVHRSFFAMRIDTAAD